MKCLICGEKVVIKRKLLTLFQVKKEYLCNKCYAKYPLDLKIENVILENYYASVISMFARNYKIDYTLFTNEYSRIFSSYYKKKGFHTLFFDYLSFNDYTLELLNTIAELFESNLIIIVLYVKKY